MYNVSSFVENEYSKYLTAESTSLVDVIKLIDQNERGIVFVVDNFHHLLGTITDGDVRRHIIKYGSLTGIAKEILKSQPIVIQKDQLELADSIMKKKIIRSVPVIDDCGTVIDIIFFDKVTKSPVTRIDTPVVIMAGGKGTRLKPYTNILPKPLIPVGDKTITEHIIQRFIEQGCNDFTLIVNYKKRFIESYFKELDIDYSISFVEEDEYRGTGGGLRLLEGRLQGDFFMTNCDILIKGDYADIIKYHREKRNVVTMVCAVKNNRLPYGTVELSSDGNIKKIKEKPELSFLTNTGFYVINTNFIREIPESGLIQITDVMQNCIDKGYNIGAYPISEDCWLDMGQMEELQKMKDVLSKY